MMLVSLRVLTLSALILAPVQAGVINSPPPRELSDSQSPDAAQAAPGGSATSLATAPPAPTAASSGVGSPELKLRGLEERSAGPAPLVKLVDLDIGLGDPNCRNCYHIKHTRTKLYRPPALYPTPAVTPRNPLPIPLPNPVLDAVSVPTVDAIARRDPKDTKDGEDKRTKYTVDVLSVGPAATADYMKREANPEPAAATTKDGDDKKTKIKVPVLYGKPTATPTLGASENMRREAKPPPGGGDDDCGHDYRTKTKVKTMYFKPGESTPYLEGITEYLPAPTDEVMKRDPLYNGGGGDCGYRYITKTKVKILYYQPPPTGERLPIPTLKYVKLDPVDFPAPTFRPKLPNLEAREPIYKESTSTSVPPDYRTKITTNRLYAKPLPTGPVYAARPEPPELQNGAPKPGLLKPLTPRRSRRRRVKRVEGGYATTD